MPELPIGDARGRVQDIDPQIVWTVMLYPRDEAARTERLARFTEQFIALLEKEVAPRWKSHKGRLADLSKLGAGLGRLLAPLGGFQALAAARSWAELRERDDQRVWPACVAGDVFFQILKLDAAGLGGSVNKAVAIGRDYLKGATTEDGRAIGGASDRYIRTQWEHFRPVVHLWAAFRTWQFDSADYLNGPDSWSPFLPKGLPSFLFAAEWLLRKGAAHHARATKTPTLRLRDAWRVPRTFKLRPMDLAIPQPEDWALEALRDYKAPKRD